MVEYITIQEYEEKIEKLTENEFHVLREKFNKYVDIDRLGDGKYRIRATKYVGNITLPDHQIIISPKIGTVNFSYMLSSVYGFSFRKEDFAYRRIKEEIIFEQLVKNLLSRIEDLCRKGISKFYYEIEENLTYVKGKLLIKKNLTQNLILKNRVYCSYSDYGPDSVENQILKYTLYFLSKIKIQDVTLLRKIKLLLHYFESVSFVSSYKYSFPKIVYNRLTQHYEPIINLCELLLLNSSLNLGTTGHTVFSSFLIDMNVLFEKFVTGLLALKLKKKGLKVKGAKRKERSYSDEEKKTRMEPDIVIRKDQKPLLLIDAKYKDKILEDDLYQIWIYCVVYSLPKGILVYPKHITISDEMRTLRKVGVKSIIKNIDLNKGSLQEFEKECTGFAQEIELIINELSA